MTLTAPPPGGRTCISRSIPAGGQITPLDCASLSLNGSLLPSPNVGASPLTSGGHAAPSPCSGTRSLPADCASAAPVEATLMNIAKIRRIGRKGKSLVVECEDNLPGIPNVPAAVRANQGAHGTVAGSRLDATHRSNHERSDYARLGARLSFGYGVICLKTCKIISSGRLPRLKASPEDRSLPCSCMRSIRAPQTHWATHAK